jgi:predicted dienelactone hydrolase
MCRSCGIASRAFSPSKEAGMNVKKSVATLTCVVAAAMVQSAGSALAADVRVGHAKKQITVTGSRGEARAVDVHLWYPAAAAGFAEAPRTVYRSALWGEDLGTLWDPLAWSVDARIARENVPIEPSGRAFPVIVFSHGSMNEPIDYAFTLELLAGAGFVVAAPAHSNNTQDDVRRDYVNGLAGSQVLECNDGLPSGIRRLCIRSTTPPPPTPPLPPLMDDVPGSMADRVHDITAVLNALPGWYGDRVDASQAGVLGHSRGTVTALAAAGGSTAWHIAPESRIKAVMGLAIGGPGPTFGGRGITFGANLADVHVPAVLLYGALDANSLPVISKDAFAALGSTEKEIVEVGKAVHRSFDSTYCAQMQSAAGFAWANSRAVLDRHTVKGIVAAPISGEAMDYCSSASFPPEIRPLVTTLTIDPKTRPAGFDFARAIPTTELVSDDVIPMVMERAVPFFARALTPPLIEHSIVGTFGTNGWYVSDVAVSWTVSDPESDVTSSAGCDPSSVTADTAGVTFTCTASSAGGSFTVVTPSMKRDATAPTVTYGGNAGTYGVDDTVSITCMPHDNLSGVAESTCRPVSGPAYTFGSGAHTFDATATDNAGNVGTGTATFTVEVTPSGLCALTREFLRSPTAPGAAVDALSATACAWVSRIVSRVTPAQKALAVGAYEHVVTALVTPGWLTAAQAETLARLAHAL